MAAALLSGCGPGADGTHPKPDTRLPEALLSGLSDEPAISTTALRGSSLIINFWATWCDPCRREMPSLERLSRRVAAHGVRVIGVTADEDLNLAREFVRAKGLTFPNYTDGKSDPLRRLLRITALPESLLVSADGTIRARIAGARDWDDAEAERIVQQSFGIVLEARK